MQNYLYNPCTAYCALSASDNSRVGFTTLLYVTYWLCITNQYNHYKNNFVTIPIVEYFTLGNKENLLEAFYLSNSVLDNYTLDDRYKYGFPISNIEYGTSMKKLVLSL